MPERLRLWTQRWPRALMRALLPSACALCGALGEEAVCGACRDAYVGPPRARCPVCANPVSGAGCCGACLADPPAFDAVVAGCDYAAPLDQIVLRLKFGGQLALAPWCARTLRDALLAQPGLALPDLLCPVPLGPRRLVERGFNQALEVARPLASALGVPLRPRLAVRERDTRAQSGVGPAERRENVRGAFAPGPEAGALDGLHVGIVDDVMTSGQTLDALAGALKDAGARRVTGFVFARTPPH